MSEARALLERFRDNLRSLEKGAAEQRVFDLAEAMAQSAIALELALATQPEPGAVPELPDWVGALVLAARDALDRLEDSERDAGEEYEEAIALRAALAARERARRAP